MKTRLFKELSVGEIFRKDSCTYRKFCADSATLLRQANGELSDGAVTHPVSANTVVMQPADKS